MGIRVERILHVEFIWLNEIKVQRCKNIFSIISVIFFYRHSWVILYLIFEMKFFSKFSLLFLRIRKLNKQQQQQQQSFID